MRGITEDEVFLGSRGFNFDVTVVEYGFKKSVARAVDVLDMGQLKLSGLVVEESDLLNLDNVHICNHEIVVVVDVHARKGDHNGHKDKHEG